MSAPRPALSGTAVATGVLTSAVAGGLVAASLGGRATLAGAVFPVQVALAAAWVGSLRVRAGLSAVAIVVVAAAAADVLVATGPRDARRLMPVLAVSLLVALLHQLARRDGRPQLTASIAATVSAVTMVCALASFVALRAGEAGGTAVLAALAGAAGAVLLAWLADLVLPRPTISPAARRGWPGLVLGLAAGAAIGAAVGGARRAADTFGGTDGLLVGGAAAAVALAVGIGVELARMAAGPPEAAPGGRRTAALLPLAVVLPLAAAGPVAYVTGRVLVG